MFQFFEAISDIFRFVISFFEKIIDVFEVSIRALVYITSIFSYLPTFFTLAIMPLLTLLIVLHVVNRG